MSAVGEEEDDNMEKYITLGCRSPQIIDSAQFMLASLDKFVNSMAKHGEDGFTISRA